MKKRILILFLLAALVLTGCTGKETRNAPQYTVLATVFPIYDWAREIIGDSDGIELVYLAGNGVDLHSYQVTAADMARISACDLFLYIGGESDEWVEEVLASVPNPNRRELSMMDVLLEDLHEEEIVEGMQTKAGFGGEEEEEYDEHIWLSLRNARAACAALTDALAELDGTNAAVYRKNCDAYTEQLDALDASFRAFLPAAKTDTLLFCDRFPFRYLTEDYGLRYYAAFSGCSGDSEASFATVLFLAEKAETLRVPAVLQLENADGKLASTVVGCIAGAPPAVLTLDSMQAVSLQDAQAGYTYLGTMENNLLVLRQALN